MPFMDALTFLSEHVPLFAGVSQEALSPLAAGSTIKKFAPAQTVLYAGMTVDALHVIAIGTAAVMAKIPNKGTQQVAELKTGDVFGEVSMLERSLATASVKAGAEGVVVLMIPEESFRSLAAADPAFETRVRSIIDARRQPPPKAAA